MPDEITYDRVEEAEEKILNNLNDVKTTVDTLPEKVEQKLDPVQDDMAKLVEAVQKQVDELRDIVENSPAGVLPPTLMYFYAESTDEGIKLTYKAGSIGKYTDNNPKSVGYDYSNDIASLTKGIMFRYSETTFPIYKTEGTLAFIDEDLFTVNASYGHRESKEKVNTITGLTNGKKYYISAFPYSTTNVYNEASGYNKNNRQICTWTGTKGTLTVNVTQDYDYKPLGEYTATLTPTAGGDAVTKTQSGAATIVFSGLEAGEYTLSFSDVTIFTKPQNQSVTVIAGQSQTISTQYQLNVSLSSLSWAEIDEYAQMGVANQIFSVGDTKDVSVNGESLTFEIVGFNHDDLADGSGKAGITFGMKNLMANKRSMNSSDTNSGSYAGSVMNTYVGTTFYNGMPDEVRNVIKSVKKVTGNGGSSNSWSGTRTDNFKTWLFSEEEVFGTKKYSVGNEGSKYARFTSNSSRTKKLSNGSGSADYWWLRSPYLGNDGYFCGVNSGGSANNNLASSSRGVCVGFCV